MIKNLLEEIKQNFNDWDTRYNDLLQEMNNKDDLKLYAETLYPIFKEVPICDIGVCLSEDDPFTHGLAYVDNNLILCIEFRYRDRWHVRNWFEKSKYEKYEIYELNPGTYGVYIKVKDLLKEEIPKLQCSCCKEIYYQEDPGVFLCTLTGEEVFVNHKICDDFEESYWQKELKKNGRIIIHG